ncbi:AAA family ATPase [Mesorhizobium sp. Mes31]|uniref:AAA family ATPase n=1 Tax=Mesorhizobium sp. Mes31 TaxID=2926017 RepID=UPI0021178DDC|nr:AAA family ATPase [Mesorhizobium sp. Mes31]
MTLAEKIPVGQAVAFGDLLAKTPQMSASAAEAISFLKILDPTGRHNLVAFDPARDHGAPLEGRTFAPTDWSGIAAFVDKHCGINNVYFSANEPAASAPNDKLRKEHIGKIRAVYADVDPASGVDLSKARDALAAQAKSLAAGTIPPTVIIDSGGGFQYLWRLVDKLDPKTFQPWAESQGRALAQELGGDAVQNIDRILRLPGTENLPTPSKIAKGRIKRKAKVVSADPGRQYPPTTLSNAVAPVLLSLATDDSDRHIFAARLAIDINDVQSHSSLDDLPAELQTRFARALADHPGLQQLWAGDRSARIGDANDDSSSAWRMSLAIRLSGIEGFNAHDYARLVYVWPHLADDQHKMDERQLSKDWGKFGAPNVEARRQLIEKFFDAEDPGSLFGEQPSDAPSVEMYRTLSIADMLSMPDPQFVVDRHLPERSLGFLYGAPGAKKSFIALDWALHLAFGKNDWHGDPIKTKPDGVVLFLAGEGAAGMKVRARAWMQQHQIPQREQNAGRFHLIPQSVELMKPENVRKLANTLRLGLGKPVIAIIVDTVSRAMPGADENMQKDMSLFVRACDTLKDEFDCLVLGVHHAGKKGDMRGSTVLLGAGDFVFRMECDRGRLAGHLHCEKMKDAPDGWSNAYRFDVVNVGVDGAGKVLSSLVPSRSGQVETDATPELTARIFAAMQAAWDAGAPWAKSNHKTGDRWAVRQIVTGFGIAADQAERLLDLWERTGEIMEETFDKKSKRKGYRVADAEQDSEGTDGVFE